ncbi:MAG: kelch repeat-containing protein, partial [Bacteroidota bacterium]
MKQFILILLLLTALESQGQYVWKQNADIPTKGCFQSAFVIGDVAYAGLGCISFNGYKTTDKFYKYDPVGDTWTPVASFPGGGRYGAAAFALKGKGYICFGRDDAQNWNNEIWEYDPAADTWTRKKDFPGGARYESTGFAINDTGYIAGGSFNAGTNYLKDAWRYFPVSDVWSQLPDLPVEHKSAAAGLSLNGKGYVLGGLNDTYTASNDNLVYDPELNHWTQLPSFPGAPLRDPAAFTLEGKIFLGAGMNPDPSGSEVFSSFRAFDPALSTWSSCPGLPSPASPRYGATGFTVADAGYVSDAAEICASDATVRTLTLKATNATVYLPPSVAPVYNYQWLDTTGTPIPGANNSTYTVASAFANNISSNFSVIMTSTTPSPLGCGATTS